ncbi:hypothetical protein [Nocardioides sp. LS1]|uniref:hypothetical protein n=1 Tax=Nocardioides sp. LS1 TaxID=1027620 RepID=UPI000F622B46|nr:hypothetical protein [Nocardioides sp. LS1]GCD88556.1 hypothetical protein NLS1_05620 [Nocardioides sp. LS1]
MKTLTIASLCLASAASAAAVATGVAASGAAPVTAAAPHHVTHHAAPAAVDPGAFATSKPNPYFPLKPGTVVRYRGVDEGHRLTERLTITHDTKMIQGVKTRVVHDVLRRADGSVAERTWDWYAADQDGNVWYFGENTATYDEHGNVDSREGSWRAGRDGARAGIIMPAHPRPTDAYRQEFLRGHAEDQAWVVQNDATVRVAGHRYTSVVRSFEWSRLEKGVVSVKYYAQGVGIVTEQDLAGGSEKFEAVSVTHP